MAVHLLDRHRSGALDDALEHALSAQRSGDLGAYLMWVDIAGAIQEFERKPCASDRLH